MSIKIQCDKVCILKLILFAKLAYMYARQILKKISEKVVVMINKIGGGGGGILEFVGSQLL